MQPHRVFQTPSARGALQPRSARKSAFAGRSPNPAPPPQRVHKLRQLFAFLQLPPFQPLTTTRRILPCRPPPARRIQCGLGRAPGKRFRPEERASGRTCPVHPWLTLLISIKPSEFSGHTCPEWVRLCYASNPRLGRQGPILSRHHPGARPERSFAGCWVRGLQSSASSAVVRAFA